METKDSAVKLLRDWKYSSRMCLDERFFSKEDIAKIYSDAAAKTIDLASRLDKMAGAAGISIINGQFAYESDKTKWRLESDGGRFFTNFPVREQQAIQEWLLIKNENTKSND